MEGDLPAIVKLLADDELGAMRERDEDPLPQEYRDAFAAMERQGAKSVILAIDNGEVIGCLQLTFIPGLARLGMTRAQIEGVRVDRRPMRILSRDAVRDVALSKARRRDERNQRNRRPPRKRSARIRPPNRSTSGRQRLAHQDLRRGRNASEL